MKNVSSNKCKSHKEERVVSSPPSYLHDRANGIT